MKSFFIYALVLFSYIITNAQCTTLIISEYIEGTSTNKALEFTNVGDKPIGLNDFEVRFFNNGATEPSRIYEFPVQELGSSEVFTVVYPEAALFPKFDTTYTFNFNGNDAIQLVYKPTELIIDVLGKVGEDPGDGWKVDTVEKATLDHTLVRKIGISEGITDWSLGADSWLVFEKDDTSNVGKHQIETLLECTVIVKEQECAELIFSEYLEGSSQNKALEIANVSNGTIDLIGWRVEQLNNGSFTSSRTLILPNISLLSGETFTMVHPNATALDTTLADTLFSFNFNGNDVLLLIDGNTSDTVDVIGQVGEDPGNGWLVSNDNMATLNHTLIRKSVINTGTNDWMIGMNQWQVFEEDYSLDFGTHIVDALNACLITSVTEEAVNSKQIKTIYTIQGKELQVLQYNTPLILEYTDGRTEKVYYVE